MTRALQSTRFRILGGQPERGTGGVVVVVAGQDPFFLNLDTGYLFKIYAQPLCYIQMYAVEFSSSSSLVVCCTPFCKGGDTAAAILYMEGLLSIRHFSNDDMQTSSLLTDICNYMKYIAAPIYGYYPVDDDMQTSSLLKDICNYMKYIAAPIYGYVPQRLCNISKGCLET